MRYKAIFVAGLAVGFVAGTRAGRERYDQMIRLTRQAAGSPQVQKATATVTAKTADLAKTAMPKVMDTAKQAADHLPFSGKASGTGADGSSGEASDDAGPQARQQADGSPASYNGIRAD
jgi:hypothetical protein